jgi:hypothetical protein
MYNSLMFITPAFQRHKYKVYVFIVLFILVAAGYIGINRNRVPSKSITYGLALSDTLSYMSHQDRIRELSQIKNMGFSEVRINILWSDVQPKNGNNYEWAQTDSIMQDVKSSGLKSVIILDRTPTWARPADCRSSFYCMPENNDAFAKFAASVVRRYKGYGVNAWEIWNEPNIVNFSKPTPNPDQYTQLLKATYVAIKQQDNTAVVLIGGLAGNAIDGNKNFIDARTYLNRIYEDNGKDYFDGVAYHPYTDLRLPDVAASHNGWPKMYGTKPSIRSIMVANGDQDKSVWITEMGVPTNGPGVEVTKPGNLPLGADHTSALFQAQIAQKAIADLKNLPWVQDYDWYTYKDSSMVATNSGSFYGILSEDGKAKPIYYVFKNSMR